MRRARERASGAVYSRSGVGSLGKQQNRALAKGWGRVVYSSFEVAVSTRDSSASMSYFTYRLFRDITLDQLKAKTEANLALYEPESNGAKIRVTGFQGDGCSALRMGFRLHEEEILRPIGFQFGGIWMDVRYQDGDSWDLSLLEGAEQRTNHSVNPWAFDSDVEYSQRHVDHRINRVCTLWPHQGESLRPYLLPWRMPITEFGRTRFIPRKGKAYDADQYEYGDAYQIYDFVRRFGIQEESRQVEIGRNAE